MYVHVYMRVYIATHMLTFRKYEESKILPEMLVSVPATVHGCIKTKDSWVRGQSFIIHGIAGNTSLISAMVSFTPTPHPHPIPNQTSHLPTSTNSHFLLLWDIIFIFLCGKQILSLFQKEVYIHLPRLFPIQSLGNREENLSMTLPTRHANTWNPTDSHSSILYRLSFWEISP